VRRTLQGEIEPTVCMQNKVPVSAAEHGTTRHVCGDCVHFPSVLDAFRNVAKSDYYFHYVRPSDCLSVCLSIRTENSAHVGQIFVKFFKLEVLTEIFRCNLILVKVGQNLRTLYTKTCLRW